ncbi:unnamed protein product [Closterium sp. Naga37s-1]|nr:unnamed protein product [Closterium sp. Naga37s-1]
MAGDDDKAVEKAGDGDVDMAEEPDSEKSDSGLDEGGNGKNATNDSKKEDSDGDSDGDDSEDDDSEDEKEAAEEAERKAMIDQVKARIASNPYDYQAHVQLISLLRRSSMLEELRAAREAMNALFPLSPAMWQQWAHDETRLIASDADVAKVEALFKRGVEEYVVSLSPQPPLCLHSVSASSSLSSSSLSSCYTSVEWRSLSRLPHRPPPRHHYTHPQRPVAPPSKTPLFTPLHPSGPLAYLAFLAAHHPAITTHTPDGLKLFRTTAEQALSQVGLHLGEGASVWGTFRGFEMEVLRKTEGEEEKTKQAARVRALFHRQLAVPHLQLPATLAAYLAWEEEEGGEKLPTPSSESSPDVEKLPGSVKAAYLKAERMVGERRGVEERVERLEGEKRRVEEEGGGAAAAGGGGGGGGGKGKEGEGGAVATFEKTDELMQAYTEYLALEAASGDMPRQQAMHERAVTGLPVVFDVWLKYIDLVDHRLKVPSVVRSVYSRAARNCPWVGTLWTRYLLALERLGTADADVAEVFEKALVSGVQSAEEYFDIFLTRLDGLRRRRMPPPESSKGAAKGAALSEDEKSKLVAAMRATFERAAEFMASYFPDHQQAQLHLAGYQAHIECQLERAGEGASGGGATGAAGEAAGRAIWEQFVRKHGSSHQAWLGFTHFETERGCYNQARSVFRRCYSRKFDSPSGTEEVCSAWIRFEREWGTLSDLDLASDKEDQAQLYQQHRQQQQQKQQVEQGRGQKRKAEGGDARGGGGRGEKGRGGGAGGGGEGGGGGGERGGEGGGRDRGKRQRPGLGFDKRQGRGKEGLGKEAGSAGDGSAEEGKETVGEKGKEGKKAEDGERKKDDGGEGQEQGGEKQQEEEKEAERKDGGEQGQKGQQGQQGQQQGRFFTDKNTVFLSNLELSTTQAEIRELLKECGEIQDVRMVFNHSTGQFRGFAYVELASAEAVAAAEKLNRTPMRGRQVSIKKSDPSHGSGHRDRGRGRGRGWGGGGGGGGRGRGGGREGHDEAEEEAYHPSTRGGRGGRGGRGLQPLSASARRGGQLQLIGSPTFAMPRAVGQALGRGVAGRAGGRGGGRAGGRGGMGRGQQGEGGTRGEGMGGGEKGEGKGSGGGGEENGGAGGDGGDVPLDSNAAFRKLFAKKLES